MAVKQMSVQEKDTGTLQTICDEIGIFQRVNHENIVKFLGLEVHHVSDISAPSLTLSSLTLSSLTLSSPLLFSSLLSSDINIVYSLGESTFLPPLSPSLSPSLSLPPSPLSDGAVHLYGVLS